MFLLQKWPDASSPDLAMSLNNQSDSVSELEGRLGLVARGSDANVCQRQVKFDPLAARGSVFPLLSTTFTHLFRSRHRQEAQ
jgi:hypothetical protein